MNSLLWPFALVLSITLCLPRPSQADPTGNDNPTGATGEYSGSTATAGGALDPYTGNSKRVIEDLNSVTGSIGEYPLKWTRILNTRGGGYSFGDGGGWKHSYGWGLSRQEVPGQCGNGCICDGPHGTVTYPDGRRMDLRWEDGDQAYVQADGWEPMGDRVVRMGGNNYDLRLKDGGRVEFHPASGMPAGAPSAIVDPYGQRTTLEYTGGQLRKIREPGGRFLQIFYETHSWQGGTNPVQTVYRDVIKRVEAYDGLGNLMEKVVYNYEEKHAYSQILHLVFLNLIRVDYDDGSHAHYTYDEPNVAIPGNGWSLCAGTIKTCNDVRFAGPMSKVEYEYYPPGGLFAWGQVKAEKRLGGPAVCTVNYHATFPDRTETRPDGATRSFWYGGTDGLWKYTDFTYAGETPHYTTIDFVDGAFGNPNHYLRTVTDARNYTTSTEKEKNIGAVIAVIHPNNLSRVNFHYADSNNPHYLDWKEDERGKITYYDRYSANDPANPNRVWQIRYPDGGVEKFTYNNRGQVLTHQLASGGVEEFRYWEDDRGLKSMSWPAPTESDPAPWTHPTYYYYYKFGVNTPGDRLDLLDRLQCVVDPLGYGTWYEYNKRGQVTKVTHQDGTYTENYYNEDGTLRWSEDELRHRTTYTYDEYKRVKTMENAVHKTVINSYASWRVPNDLEGLWHTTSSIFRVTSHMGKVTDYDYDANFRRKRMTVGQNTSDAATTSYTYDPVGNLETVTEPKLQGTSKTTRYEYDPRNRRKSMTDAIGHKTEWEYDYAGNMTKEIRADLKFRTWDEYDAMNRVKQTTGFLGAALETTKYDYDTAGNLTKVTDPNLRVYQTVYDALNRKTTASYPTDATGVSRSESWRYDIAGNVLWYKNTAFQFKHFGYDDRNRLTRSYWNTSYTDTTPNWSIGPETIIEIDDANRVTEIKTNNSETRLAFGYDAANHKIWEDQTVAGFTHRVATDPDDDGNRRTLSVSNVPGLYSFTYDYTPRQQLKQINRGGSSYVEFSYDPNGNLTRRQNMVQGQARDATKLQYDDLNRVTICEQTDFYDAVFARSNYNDYDAINNLKSISRQSYQELNKGELFTYDPANQLSSVSYKADVEWHTPGSAPGGTITEVAEDGAKETLAALAADPEREPRAKDSVEIESISGPHTVTYENDAINRLSMIDSNLGLPVNFNPNHLNQYTAVTAHGALTYDGNLNVSGYDGWAFVHDAEKRLVSVTGNGHSGQFAYDGLGRCVKRTIDGATTLFTYDDWKPVAEWTGAGVFVAWNLYGAGADEILVRYQQNPAGYLHYHLDPMGNVQFLLSDQPDAGLEKYTYDVFGKPTIIGWNGGVRPISNHGNRFLFTGREYLYTFGLYDYRHRTYHPGLGRFIETDPIGFEGDSLNLYRYCGGNPINHSDPMGLEMPKKKDDDADNYYGRESKPYSPGPGLLEGVNESNMDRFTIGGPPEPGTSWAPGDWRPNDRGIKNVGSAPGNPYRDSAPFITELAPGFDEYHLPAHAAFWETFADHVPDFIPSGGVARVGSGLRRAGTVIGRLNDIQILRQGERSLLSRLPNLGSHRLNWAQNARLLRQEMSRNLPIRDASLGHAGGQFLEAERNLLRNHGWNLDATGYWMPPR